LYSLTFYTLEQYFNQSLTVYCVTEFLIILVLDLRFYLHTLYMYSLIAYCQLITFPCIKPIYVSFIYGTYKLVLLLLLVLYCHVLFSTVSIGIVMTSSVSTLVDLWNIEYMIMN
jgi:hypothetical protein